MDYPVRVLRLVVRAAVCLLVSGAAAQNGSAPSQKSPTPPPTAQADEDQPTKAPKPKSRMNLLRQMQVDLTLAAPHAQVDGKGRKKLDKCHDTLLDAIAQQQRYKSVNVGKINGCLNDLDKLLDVGAFAAKDRDKLSQDSQKLGESVGKPHRIHLPQPL